MDIATVINLYSKTRSSTVDFNQFWRIWDMVKTNYVAQPVDETKLFYGALSGIVQGLEDPILSIFRPKAGPCPGSIRVARGDRGRVV